MADILTVTFLPYQERDGLGGLAVARGRGRGRGDWSVGTPGSVQEITYTVPADKCGLVIGKGKRQLVGVSVPYSCSREEKPTLRPIFISSSGVPDLACYDRGNTPVWVWAGRKSNLPPESVRLLGIGRCGPQALVCRLE